MRLNNFPFYRLTPFSPAKRVRFPLEDQTPTPDGKPAVREYRAIAVIGDDEVGEPSSGDQHQLLV